MAFEFMGDVLKEVLKITSKTCSSYRLWACLVVCISEIYA